AGTLRRLREKGMSRPEACRLVAKQLKKSGVKSERGSGEVTATTVRHWYRTVAEDVARRGTAAIVFDSMFTAEEDGRFNQLDQQRGRALALASLSEFVRQHFPAPPKAT